MAGLVDDIRHAIRRLVQQPGFTAVAVLTLAIGLGANTAIFSLIHGVLLRPLPVADPHELYRLGETNDCCVNSGLPTSFSLFSYPLYEHFRTELTEFSDLAAFQANVTATGVRASSGGVSQTLRAAYVSGNYFRMFGITPAAGRLFEPGDDRPGAPPVLVISHQAWTDQFGGDPGVVGGTFYVGGTAMTLVGVTPREFFGDTVRPNPATMWLPLSQEPVIRGASSLLARPDQHWLYAIGRLRPGADRQALDGRATRAVQTFLAAQTFLSDRGRQQIADQRVVVTSAEAGVQVMRANFGQSLTMLFAMSGLVLLIASANLANLLVARADRGQAAVRAALGASSRRLLRQSMIEGVVLALAGGAGALLVSMFATRAIMRAQFANATMPVDLSPSIPILLFSIGLALATGVVFSILPALSMARTNPIDALRGAGRDGREVAFLPRRVLVVVQVALSLILLAGAGVLAKSLNRLENQPLGFDAEHRLAVFIDPPPIAGDPDRLAAMYTSMQDRLRRIPGVVDSTYSLYSPMSGDNWSSLIAISGRPIDPENREGSSWNRVGPRFFETIGTRIVRGRSITDTDTPASARVAVVNLAFVRRFFPEQEPIGARLGIGDASNAGDYEIVGVADDVKFTGANQPTRPMIFLPVMQLAPQASPQSAQVQARSTLVRALTVRLAPGTPSIEPALRQALAQVHPDLTITRILSLAEQVSGNFRQNRMLAGLTTAYGALALALAALGLYGVTSYSVSRRTREIGVRMALGATRGRIVWTVVRSALAQACAGLAVGVPAALFLSGYLASMLYEVEPRDAAVYGAAVATLVATSVLAALWPARRASSVEPTTALRAQ